MKAHKFVEYICDICLWVLTYYVSE